MSAQREYDVATTAMSNHNGLAQFIEYLQYPAVLFTEAGELICANPTVKAVFESITPESSIAFLYKQLLLENIDHIEDQFEWLDSSYRRTAHRILLDGVWVIYVTLEPADDKESPPSHVLLSDELEMIVESVHDGIYVTDGNGFTLRINEAYSKLTGITKEEVIGKHVCELVNKGYFDNSVTLNVLKHRGPISMLQKIKNDSQIWLATGHPVFDKTGAIRRIINTIYDMTELNNLRDSLKSKEISLANTKRQVQILKSQVQDIPGITAKSYMMKAVVARVTRVAGIDSTVLILGETGCGKNVIARTIHKLSQRSDKNFIEVNCGAIPEQLFESELFGYAAGAFTGANKSGKLGLLEAAHQGTVFLDEIGEISLSLQVKLLTFLQDRRIRRIGDTKDIEVDVRVIAATHKDPKKLMAENKLREDLYYRLTVVPITIPPLRARKDDIYVLVDCFLKLNNQRHHCSVRFTKAAYLTLENYDWPGNVRELEHIVEQLVVLAEGDTVDVSDLPEHILAKREYHRPQTKRTLKEMVDEFERQVITEMWEELQDTSLVAQYLGVHRTTLMRKMQKLNMTFDI